jgi:hypothetical protein
MGATLSRSLNVGTITANSGVTFFIGPLDGRHANSHSESLRDCTPVRARSEAKMALYTLSALQRNDRHFGSVVRAFLRPDVQDFELYFWKLPTQHSCETNNLAASGWHDSC